MPNKEGVGGGLPAFRLSPLKKGLAKLPAPAAAFGLDLRETPIYAELKELAGLKNLQALSLYGTKITGVGLNELAGLKNLQTLDLGKTEVTMRV